MPTTIADLLLLVGFFALSIIVWGLFLATCLYWAKAADAGWLRITAAAALVLSLNLIVALLCYLLARNGPLAALSAGLVSVVVWISIPVGVSKCLFHIGWLRSLQAWLPTLLSGIAVLLLSSFLFRPFVAESFRMPTNAMAPTLVGEHWRSACPECGKATICPIRPESHSRASEIDHWMICENFHVSKSTTASDAVFPGDRFMIAKFVSPRRWDMVAFRYPEDPSQIYGFRVVGLPGEEIEIRDGHVWANGEQLTMPASLRGIEYVTEIPHYFGSVWGTPDQPAKLGDDEYFVLGDFSIMAKDSRVWTTGAADRAPYAVPESHLVGVITTIYWPPERWRAFR